MAGCRGVSIDHRLALQISWAATIDPSLRQPYDIHVASLQQYSDATGPCGPQYHQFASVPNVEFKAHDD